MVSLEGLCPEHGLATSAARVAFAHVLEQVGALLAVGVVVAACGGRAGAWHQRFGLGPGFFPPLPLSRRSARVPRDGLLREGCLPRRLGIRGSLELVGGPV